MAGTARRGSIQLARFRFAGGFAHGFLDASVAGMSRGLSPGHVPNGRVLMEAFSFPALEGVPVAIKGSSPAERAAEIVAHARATAESVSAAALAAVVRELDAAARSHREHVEREAAELAVALAEKVVGASLEVKPELILDV